MVLYNNCFYQHIAVFQVVHIFLDLQYYQCMILRQGLFLVQCHCHKQLLKTIYWKKWGFFVKCPLRYTVNTEKACLVGMYEWYLPVDFAISLHRCNQSCAFSIVKRKVTDEPFRDSSIWWTWVIYSCFILPFMRGARL